MAGEDRELQETLMRIEIGKKQLESLLAQSKVIETTLIELHSATEVLEQLKGSKVGTEILVPIGGDSFIKASIKDTDSVIAGVGAKVSVEKKTEEAIKTIKERAEELGKLLARARENAVGLNSQMEELSGVAQDLMQKSRAEK